MESKKKILIIRLTSLGDVIFTIPLANALKAEGHQVDWLVAEKGLGVVENNPCTNKVHFFPLGKWRKNPFSIKKYTEFWKLIHELRQEKYDIALDCQQMFKSLFLFLFCDAKRRITFKDARELSVFAGNEFVTPKARFTDNNYHIVERNLDFARHIGINNPEITFTLPETSDEAKRTADRLLKDVDYTKKVIAISPATTWKNKYWDENNWIELVKELSTDYSLIFTGTNADKDLLNRIGADNYTNLCGKTTVEELREVFSRCNLVISPDSGSAHLAWASAKPSVIAIFTCTPPKRFGPYGESKNGAKYISIGGKLPCQPCFKKKCKKKNNQMDCTIYPSAKEIVNIVKNIL